MSVVLLSRFVRDIRVEPSRYALFAHFGVRQAKPGKVVHGSATHPRRDENGVWWRCADAIKVVILIGTPGSAGKFDSRAYGGTPHCCFEHAEQNLLCEYAPTHRRRGVRS